MSAYRDSPFGVDPGVRPREPGMPEGACVHTVGRGIALGFARENGREPNAEEATTAALRWYAEHDDKPGYLVGLDGVAYRVAEDRGVTQHVGGKFRDDYLSGRWVGLVNPTFLRLWRARWPGYKSPQHLFKGRSANGAYVGIELLPVTAVSGVTPASPEETFTLAQYVALDELLLSLETEHGWPEGWRKTARLVGHEDVGPLGKRDGRGMHRFDAGGGWDPGNLRRVPRFRWDRLGGRP